MFMVAGQGFSCQLKSEVFARFLGEAELLNLLQRYRSALKMKNANDYVPSEADRNEWLKWIDGKELKECAREMGTSVSTALRRFGTVGKEMAKK